MPLLSRIEFGALAQYAVRGSDPNVIQRSKIVRDAVKKGDIGALDRAVGRLLAHPDGTAIRALFGPDVVLVPTPGSAPLKKNSLWVPQRICDALLRGGLAAST